MTTLKISAPIRFVAALALMAPLATMLVGCAGRMAKQDQEEQAAKQQATPPTPAESRVLALNARLDVLEAKIAQMNEKLDAERATMDNFMTAHGPQTSGVPSQAANTVGTPVSLAPLANDTESGFINDASIQAYRKAEVLLISRKYSDAILAFSDFLEKYPDHPLAGSAQFHVGEAYFHEKEYARADQEFQKVLTSYDRSAHVSDTLRLMAEAEDHLGKPEDAARHRQQLTSLFANSPAAQNIAQTSVPPGATTITTPAAPTTPPAARPAAPADNSSIEEGGVPSAPVTKPMKGGLDEPPPTAPVNNE